MKTAVLFILLKKTLSHSPWVSGVREQDSTTKSLSDTSVSRGTVHPTPETEERTGVSIYRWVSSELTRAQTLFIPPLPTPKQPSPDWSFPTVLRLHLRGLGLGGPSGVQQPLHPESLQPTGDGQTFRGEEYALSRRRNAASCTYSLILIY